MEAGVGWAFGRSEPLADLSLQRRQLLGPANFHLEARYSGFEIVRFYGLGNRTPSPEPPEFYEVRQRQLSFRAGLSLAKGEDREIRIGPVLRKTVSDTLNPVNYVTVRRAYGTGDFAQAGIEASLELDSRDRVAAPTRGFHVQAGGSFYPRLLDLEANFGEAHGEASGYISFLSDNLTLAFRGGGKHLWGSFPYSDAAFLGGSETVRGLREQRFAGESVVYGSGEIRLFLASLKILFPTDVGVFGLSDAGRVFLAGESPGGWHGSVGGGIWFAPVTRSATVQVSLARSRGRSAFYVGSGFAF
jgi:outer membrane protein assembly factor BamA